MTINPQLWERALSLDNEFKRRSETAGWRRIRDALQVSGHEARALRFALDNKEVIRFQPSTFSTTDGMRELILTDVHIPYQDALAVESALSYAEGMGITDISLLGDVIDFYQISTFIKNPKKQGISAEIKDTVYFLSDLRKRFPKAKIRYTQGNHEERLDKFIMQNAGQLVDLLDDLLPCKLGLHDLGIEYCTRPYRLGKLWHLHGHEHMSRTYSPEHITNIIWKYVHDHFVCGHYHRSQEKVYKRGLSGETFWGAVIGYLAGEMDYARINMWGQSFAIVDYNSSGKFRAQIHHVCNGEVL